MLNSRPATTGPIEFYCSAEAARDDMPCTDECGVDEYEVAFTRHVKKPKPNKTPRTNEQWLKREAVVIALGNDLKSIALGGTDGDEDMALSALTWALAGFKLKRRRLRQAKRSR